MSGPDAADTGHVVAEAVRRLRVAAETHTPCGPIRNLFTDAAEYDRADLAYQVQSGFVRHKVAAGASVVGRKIGLTNPRVQAQLGVEQPDFGTLFDDMRIDQQQIVDITRLFQPRIEAEIAFVLKSDLDGSELTESEVAAATHYVVAALEIVDSRIRDWDIGILDTIADNGSSALFVLGDERVLLDGIDLAATRMTLTKNGKTVSEGTGAECLGSPLRAVAWLANTASKFGSPLRGGDVILSGALGPMVEVDAGSRFVSEITGLGKVEVSFRGAVASSVAADLAESK